MFLSLQVANLAAHVDEWTVGGTALTSLMDVERRHGTVVLIVLWYSALNKIFIPLILLKALLGKPNFIILIIHFPLSGKFKPVIKKAMVELDGEEFMFHIFIFSHLLF